MLHSLNFSYDLYFFVHILWIECQLNLIYIFDVGYHGYNNYKYAIQVHLNWKMEILQCIINP